MAELTRGQRPVSTIFDLLGTDENDVTFALGWTLRESETFFRLFLNECAAKETSAEGRSSAFSDITEQRICTLAERRKPA